MPVIPFGRPAHTARRPKPIQYAITRPAVQVVRSCARKRKRTHVEFPHTGTRNVVRSSVFRIICLFLSSIIIEKVKKKIIRRRIANDSSSENSRVRRFALDCGWIDVDGKFFYSTKFRRVLNIGWFRKIILILSWVLLPHNFSSSGKPTPFPRYSVKRRVVFNFDSRGFSFWFFSHNLRVRHVVDMTAFPPACRQQQCLLRLVSPIPNRTLWFRTTSPRRTRRPVTRKLTIIYLAVYILSFSILFILPLDQLCYKPYSCTTT